MDDQPSNMQLGNFIISISSVFITQAAKNIHVFRGSLKCQCNYAVQVTATAAAQCRYAGAAGLPGVLLGLDEPDHVLHPQHQVPDQAEEAEFVPGVQQADLAFVAGIQQVPPGFQDFALPPLDVVRFVSSVCRLEADCVLLQLSHLWNP